MPLMNWLLTIAIAFFLLSPLVFEGQRLTKIMKIATYFTVTLLVLIGVACYFDTNSRVIEKSNIVTSKYGLLHFSKPVRIIEYERKYEWATVRNGTDRIEVIVE